MTGNSGQWVPDTSYDGFLGRSGLGASISVPTVRLEDEINDGFDFVKLDLQGGEYDALRGLGTKLRNVKLFYVEKQLFSDGLSTNYLREHGFITLFDRLQLSLRPGQSEVQFTLFREVGLVVDKIHLPDISGMPLIIWGHFSGYSRLLKSDTLSLSEHVIDILNRAGVTYCQTDALSSNPNIFSVVSDILSEC